MVLRCYLIIATTSILILTGCGPDAPHDNPLDPANLGSGVYGTVYRGTGGVVSGAVVTAKPVNIATTSDQTGAYRIRLDGGRYFLEVAYNGYKTVVDTVDIPEGDRLQHNFILKGLICFDSAGVRTAVARSWDGLTSYRITPWCLAYHPDGAGFLDEYTLTCRVDSFILPWDYEVPVDNQRKKYIWNIEVLPGIGNFPQWIVGRTVSIVASSTAHSLLVQKTVPPFLEPLPYNLYPNNGQNYFLPDTLYWENSLTSVDLAVELCLGGNCLWRRNIQFTNRIYCDTALTQAGLYTWRVVMRDASGNEGAAEATFWKP